MKTSLLLMNKQLYFRILLLDLIGAFFLGLLFYITIDWDLLYLLSINFFALIVFFLWGIFLFWRSNDFLRKDVLKGFALCVAANIPFMFLAQVSMAV